MRIVETAKHDPWVELTTETWISVAATEASPLAGSRLIKLGGSGATLAAHNLDRHWRNARTHTAHDPTRWKLHAIGQYWLSGIAPPVTARSDMLHS